MALRIKAFSLRGTRICFVLNIPQDRLFQQDHPAGQYE
jgi:hypothetical protein